MRAYLLLALLSLACSSEASSVDGGGDAFAGGPGLTEAGTAGEGTAGEATDEGASGSATGGEGTGGSGGRSDGGATGEAAGLAGSSEAPFVAGTSTDPYYLGEGKRCPQVALDALMTWYDLNPGVPDYYSSGACHGTWEPDPYLGGVIRASVDFGSTKIATKPDSCAQVTVIPEDGSETQCDVTGWYSSDVATTENLNFGGKIMKPSVGYWVVVQYFARTVRDRNSICPDACGYL